VLFRSGECISGGAIIGTARNVAGTMVQMLKQCHKKMGPEFMRYFTQRLSEEEEWE
jgi:hypothetical protein